MEALDSDPMIAAPAKMEAERLADRLAAEGMKLVLSDVEASALQTAVGELEVGWARRPHAACESGAVHQRGAASAVAPPCGRNVRLGTFL